jgi:hypothetical protein
MMSRRTFRVTRALAPALLMVGLSPAADADSGQSVSPGQSADGYYCQYSESVAEDERRTLMTPHLVASAGKVNFLSGEKSAVGNSTLRQTIGLSYSLQETLRGMAVNTRAHADCERYKASSMLLQFLELRVQSLEVAAIAARLTLLENALPTAELIVSRTKADVAAFRTTNAHLDAMSIRLDRLRAGMDQNRKALVTPVGSVPPPRFSSLRQAIAQQQAEDATYERSMSRIRRSTGWNLTVQGGYEHLSNVRDYSPYYWTVNFDMSLGLFSRHRAAEEAVSAHVAFLSQDPLGPTQRAKVLLSKLQSDLLVEQSRLTDNTILLREMEGRVDSLKLIRDIKASEYSDDVWFEMIELRAEHEYLRVHIDTLKQVVGDPGATQVVMK